MIACPHYSRMPGNRRHGQCAIGRFSGRPWAGQCLRCQSAAEPPLPGLPRMAANYLAAQATDLLAGRPRRTPEEAQAIYRTHCTPCKHHRPSDSRCSLCGCPVKDKIPMRREHCPVGKW